MFTKPYKISIFNKYSIKKRWICHRDFLNYFFCKKMAELVELFTGLAIFGCFMMFLQQLAVQIFQRSVLP